MDHSNYHLALCCLLGDFLIFFLSRCALHCRLVWFLLHILTQKQITQVQEQHWKYNKMTGAHFRAFCLFSKTRSRLKWFPITHFHPAVAAKLPCNVLSCDREKIRVLPKDTREQKSWRNEPSTRLLEHNLFHLSHSCTQKERMRNWNGIKDGGIRKHK